MNQTIYFTITGGIITVIILREVFKVERKK